MNEYLTWQLPPLWNSYGGTAAGYNPYVGPTGYISGVPIAHTAQFNVPQTLSNPRTPAKDRAMTRGAGIDPNGIMNVVTSGAAFIGDINNSFSYDKNVDDLNMQAGTGQSAINGISYKIQRAADSQKELDEVSRQNTANTIKSLTSGAATGAAIGSVIPGLGTAVGGLIGGAIGGITGWIGGSSRKDKAKEQLRLQQEQATRTTNFNRDVARSTGMQIDFKKKYGDMEDQILYHAKYGKNRGVPMYSIGKNSIVQTPSGQFLFGRPNGIAHNNEPMFQRDEQTGSIVKTGTGNKENAPIVTNDNTTLFGEMKHFNGIKFEDLARGPVMELERINKTIESIKNKDSRDVAEKASANKKREIINYLSDLEEDQKAVSLYNNYVNAFASKYGKNSVPKFAIGKIGSGWPNALAAILGIGASAAQYFDAKNQDIYTPHTYIENPYGRRALAELYGLRMSPYNMMQQLRNAAGTARYSVDRSGGLSTGQKMLQKTALESNLQNNIANGLYQIADRNIGLRSAANTAALNTGAQEASNMMNALRWDSDQYAKAHAARIAGMQTAESNFLAQIQQYIANEYKRRMGNATIDLWSDDLRNRRS